MLRWIASIAILILLAAGLMAFGQRATSIWIPLFAASCVGLAVILLYYLLLGLTMVSVLVRTILALVPVGSFAGGLIYVVLSLDALEPRIAQALIAAVVVASGWVVGFMATEWRRVSVEQERRRDIVRAVITELELIADHGSRADWDKAIAQEQAQFRKNARYDVFIFYGHQFNTLKRLVEQIEVLRWVQIRPVMDIFQALDRLERMEKRMDSERFAALPKERRERGLVRYLTITAEIPALADAALQTLRNDGPFHGFLRNLR